MARAQRQRWGSRVGVILAAAGSAIGLGNFLRFPGQAAAHGGGAFMLPYFVSLIVLGIPLAWAEWTMGRYAGVRGFRSAPGLFRVLWRHPLSKYVGALAVLIPLVVYTYYVLVETWCLRYAVGYLTGDLLKGADQVAYRGFFSEVTGAAEHGAMSQSMTVGLLVFTAVVNAVLVARGLSRGIEAFCKLAVPALAILAVVVLVRVLLLGTPDPTKPDQSVIAGLGYMWNPQPEALWDPETWLAASGQIFFSLSVGFGILLHYASYLRRSDDVVLTGLTASSMNEVFEVCLGGLITIPAAFVFLGHIEKEALGSSFQLGFVTLPNVFGLMWGGRIFGAFWFFALFLAAMTSSVSMLQPVIAFLEEGPGMSRGRASWVTGVFCAVGTGLIALLSKDLVALDTVDFWVGSVLIFVLATIQAVVYGWIFGIEKGALEAARGAQLQIPRFVHVLIKYICPVYLLVILGSFCVKNVPERIRTMQGPAWVAIGFILVTFAAIAWLVRIASRRWQEDGR